MYKIIENNQIIDVMEKLNFVKYLPKTKRAVKIDERQANGILSSNSSIIYHIYGTPNTFPDQRKSVTYEKIDKDEYDKLTKQLKANEALEERIRELEKTVKELKELLIIDI